MTAEEDDEPIDDDDDDDDKDKVKIFMQWLIKVWANRAIAQVAHFHGW